MRLSKKCSAKGAFGLRLFAYNSGFRRAQFRCGRQKPCAGLSSSCPASRVRRSACRCFRFQRRRLSSYSTGPDPAFQLRGHLRPMAWSRNPDDCANTHRQRRRPTSQPACGGPTSIAKGYHTKGHRPSRNTFDHQPTPRWRRERCIRWTHRQLRRARNARPPSQVLWMGL